MSDLQLKPELENPAGGGAADGATPPAVTAASAGSVLAQARGARRRGGMPRLRPPSDDGFHLFRVY